MCVCVCACVCVCVVTMYLPGHAEAPGENREAVTDGRVVYATSVKCLLGEHLFFTELLGATGGGAPFSEWQQKEEYVTE